MMAQDTGNQPLQLAEEPQAAKERTTLSKVLGPIHIWALGVGIVLVGEFYGWNFMIAKGGSIGALIAAWTVAMFFIMLVMINTEIGAVMPEQGGQYTMAKYLMGPLAAFNVGLMMVFEYVMLESGDLLVVGQIANLLVPGVQPLPLILASGLALTLLNYKGTEGSLTVNFVITALAFITIFVLLFSANSFDPNATMLQLKTMTDGLPFGYIGVIGAMQFAIFFYLGIEGTVVNSDSCRSTSRAIPVGSMIAIATLLIGGSLTWLLCCGLVPSEALGESAYPLFEAALATGKLFVIIALFFGTILACLASANGCINDSAAAWSALSRDNLIPDFFAKTHPKYGTNYRAIIFLLPISMVFAFTGMLDQVVTFSIFSALLVYTLEIFMMFRFRRRYPIGCIERGYTSPLHPLPTIIAAVILAAVFFGMFLGYWVNMIGGLIFYLLASIWFMKRRAKHINPIEWYSLRLPGYKPVKKGENQGAAE